ncbi:MAG: tetratricopeptide repeat protein [Methylophilaceae bacterium]
MSQLSPTDLFFEGNRFMQAGDNTHAEACFRRAIKADPEFAEAYTNLAILLESKQPKKAEQYYRSSLKLNPDSPETLANLADFFAMHKRFAEAEALYIQSIVLNPSASITHSNLGVLLACLKREYEAETYLRRALELNPENAKASFNLAYLLLLQGNFAEGWIRLEARNLNVDANLPFAKWQGEDLRGKSLLVWYELGFGDEIQFCRYVPLLKKMGVTDLTLVCRPELKVLFQTLEGVDTLYAATEHIPHRYYDFWTLPLSAPRYCQTELDSIPAQLPYLHADADKIKQWKLPENGLKKVGLVWQGNPRHENDDQRSLDVKTLAPLLKTSGIQFVNLQKGVKAQAMMTLPAEMQDFADTAAIISQLDLVICVDTAVAHLAGALNKPCWVLLPDFKTDWRWMKEQSDSPWYPNVMRLFRQGQDQRWEPVIQSVTSALQQWVDDKA